MELKVLHSLNDNYLYVLHSPIISNPNTTKPELEQVVIVDPGSYRDSELEQFLNQYDIKNVSILVTHPHWDHVNGIKHLQQDYSHLKIYTTKEIFIDMKGGGLSVDFLEAIEAPGEFNIGTEQFTVLNTPGHTQHSITYIYEEYMFAGDLLFCAGCGRVFTGTFSELYHSIQTVKAYCQEQAHLYDKHIQMCVAHEYALSNIRFARSLQQAKLNEHLDALEQRVKRTLEIGHDYTPIFFTEEYDYNPFVRANSEAEFIALRKAKDNF